MRIEKSKEQLPEALRLTDKGNSVGVRSKVRAKGDEDLELRWKNFLADNAERQTLMPWLEWKTGEASS